MPASPRSTSTWLRPASAAATRPLSCSHSPRRPSRPDRDPVPDIHHRHRSPDVRCARLPRELHVCRRPSREPAEGSSGGSPHPDPREEGLPHHRPPPPAPPPPPPPPPRPAPADRAPPSGGGSPWCCHHGTGF